MYYFCSIKYLSCITFGKRKVTCSGLETQSLPFEHDSVSKCVNNIKYDMPSKERFGICITKKRLELN